VAAIMQGIQVLTQPGKEKDIVFNIIRKQFDMEIRKTPLQILSCFFRESIPGYIYVEAYQQAHVMTAVQGMSNVYASKLRLVPVNEMVDCLTIKVKSSDLKVGAWVRMKRGKYAGDLGQVLELSEIGDTATIKLIPRLDLSKDASTVKRKKGSVDIRQPQKLFNPNDIK
jgi:transcription elongation factor SPT5